TIERPIPPPAPVISTVFPSSRNGDVSVIWLPSFSLGGGSHPHPTSPWQGEGSFSGSPKSQRIRSVAPPLRGRLGGGYFHHQGSRLTAPYRPPDRSRPCSPPSSGSARRRGRADARRNSSCRRR